LTLVLIIELRTITPAAQSTRAMFRSVADEDPDQVVLDSAVREAVA
jgi:hypothetical protein